MPAPDRKKPARRSKPAAVKKAVTKKAVAGKPAVKKAVAGKPTSKALTGKPAAKTVAARKPAATPKPARKARPAAARRPQGSPRLGGTGRRDGPDPEGFFVARVRGEEAVRDAPHQLQEPGGWEEEPLAPPLHDEGLGELPWTYGDDLLVAMPRDPRTLFVYWDQARASVDAAFAGVPGAKVQLWVFARGTQWERVRVVEVALEARGWYLHDLEPGRAYRAELHVVGNDGQDRLLPGESIPTALPPQGPSPVVDDRFATLPWGVPLPKLMGPGVPGGPFSEEARALLARLSGWSRFGHDPEGADGGSPGGPSSPSRPFSPTGPFGGEGR
jgi:hypothetical protein